MKNSRHPVSIRIKYTRYIIPILLVTFLIIGMMDVIFYFRSIHESSANEKTAYSSSAAASLESFYEQFDSDSGIFFYKPTTQSALKNLSSDNKKKAEQLFRNDASYYSSLSANYADNIYFITNNGFIFSKSNISPENIPSLPQTYLDKLAENGSNSHGLPFFFKAPDKSGRLYACRYIYEWTGKTSTTGKNLLGTLVVEIKTTVFDRFFSLNSASYHFALADNKNHIYLNYSDIPDDKITQLASEKRLPIGQSIYTVTTIPLSISTLNLFLLSNETLVYKDAKTVIILLLIPSVLSLIAIISATSFISRSIANEFTYFMKKLNDTKEITDEAFIYMDSSTEFAELSNVYNQTLSRIHALSEKVHEQEILNKNIEIENLQSQINPHFLYNTLNCISGLVDMDRKEECHRALTALADIERMSLKGKPFCTVEEALFYVKEYTYIQKLRFGEKLSILIDIPKRLSHYRIPKLVIQPLIENSVVHGTSKISGRGIIAVLGKTDGTDLQIMIKDNGPGFSTDFLAGFPSAFDQKPITSYGLYNIDRRLKLYYGNKYGLVLQNNENHGACVTIRIPLCINDEPKV